MHIFLTLTVVSFVNVIVDNVAATETTKEPPPKDEKFTFKMSLKEYVPTPDTWDTNPHLNSLWTYHPASHTRVQHDDESSRLRMVYRGPQSLTKLAKTISLGFNPYFNKGYFEPFERRPKPVTLVGIRKNGVIPRKNVINVASKSSEVAELQSPYNDVSSFWIDEPGSH